MLKPYKNGFIREEFAYVDKNMIKDCLTHYKHFNVDRDSVVLDLGMNIGGFGLMLLDKPIKQYIGVEANPENFEVAKANLEKDSRFTLHSAAVTSAKVDSITMYMTKSKQAFCSGTINPVNQHAKALRQVRIEVPTIHIDKLIEEYSPTHMKIDIEGEEYRILEHWNNKIPECVKEFSLEFHNPETIKAQYNFFRQTFIEQGFAPVFEHLNYVKGTNQFQFLDQEIFYRNIWGVDCLFRKV